MKEVDAFYKKVDASKMLMVNGKLYKTNVDKNESQEEELEYYRLVGEAYNSKKLDRATIKNGKPGSSYFTYIVDG